jgi:hypothetical protein
MRVQFPRIFARSPFPVQNEQARAQLVTKLNSGAPAEKFQTIELLKGLIDSFNAAVASSPDRQQPPEAVEQVKQLAQQLTGVLNQARGDAVRGVSGWGWHLSTTSSQGDDRTRNVRSMVGNDAWATRLLGAFHALAMPAEARAEVLRRLSTDDAEPLVRQFASASLETPAAGATTAPSPAAQEATK